MNYSIYIHVPFCKRRCHYCDFNTTVGKDALIPDYFDALNQEVRIVGKHYGDFPVHSIYFGGGTPSIIQTELLENVLKTIRSRFVLTEDCEISLEANPGTITLDYLGGLLAAGINRLSIGVQSTSNPDLRRLDRIHDVDDILIGNRNARKTRFSNISFDLIFGLPGQNLAGWENSLRRAILLEPDHLSLYSLIIEPNTLFYQWYQKGLMALQDQDVEGDMYEHAMTILAQAGYEQYEISNWAKKHLNRDLRCRHNLQYWLNQPYFGFGAGSHGYVNGFRTVNANTIPEYIKRIKYQNQIEEKMQVSPANISISKVDQQTQMMDFMMLGLRLLDVGVDQERFRQMYDLSMEDVFKKEISRLLSKGLVIWSNESRSNLRLTKRGAMVANQVFMEFT